MGIFKRPLERFVAQNRRLSKVLDKRYPKFFGRTRNHNNDLIEKIQARIDKSSKLKILEVGGIDRPLLYKSEFFSYDGLDIEKRQSCFRVYDQFFVQSVEEKIPGKYDLIISRMLFEHVPDNDLSFQAMYNALNQGGGIMHHIPSKNHFYSMITRMVGSKWQAILIKYLRPNAADGRTGYPTYFNKCSPAEMQALCADVGFKEIRIIPYYRATDYFAFFLPAYIFVAIFENICEKFNFSFFACGMNVFATKE